MLATNNLQPVILFIDADSAMQVAINTQYLKTITKHCIFHIHQNLVKKIKKKLHGNGIELRLKDETKYSRLQEFNMNPTAGLSYISNTIFKKVDDMYKKYMTPNSLALQRKQILESLLYRVLIQDMNNIDLVVPYYDIGFMEDDYEEPKILLSMALQNCSESKVKEIWKALNLAITNSSNKVFEELLQDFIKQQLSVQNENNEHIEHEIDVSKISNPTRYKSKSRSANKRYLSSIENHSKKYANSSS
ncbi:unnamed protein product [Rhizophagus irregularis]|nr:unnamed protein product [Rhizophagus irregularis]